MTAQSSGPFSYGNMQNLIAWQLGDRADLLAQPADIALALTPIQLAIQTAIQKWEKTTFWFNEFNTENTEDSNQAVRFNTVVKQEYYGASDYSYLANIAHIVKLKCTISGNRYTLTPRTAGYADDVSVNPSVSGQPTEYSYQARQLRFYPIPDGAYPINIKGTIKFPTLVATSDTNYWMQDAEPLIRCEALMDLYANTLKDMDMAGVQKLAIYGDPSQPAHRGYLYDLKFESRRRKATPRVRPTYF